MRQSAERAYHLVCLVLGGLLRSATYASTRLVQHEGARCVRKKRDRHAPLLVAMGALLGRILDSGVRVLSQRDWIERERALHHTLRGAVVEAHDDGSLILPCLPGVTLSVMLEDPALGDSDRRRAIVLAVAALVAFHQRGLTHADAMAENVLIDLESGSAHWFDFETIHDARRSMAWRRADDLRALLATCLLRTQPVKFAETIELVLGRYGDEEVASIVAASFTSGLQRPLPFHLGQASLSHQSYREIARLLTERSTPA